MADDDDEFPHYVEICDMVYWPNVGLVYHGDNPGFSIKKECHNSILTYRTRLFSSLDPPNTRPGIYTIRGELIVRDHIHGWLEERGWEYQISRTATNGNSECRLIIKFKDLDQALLFKLTWAG